MVAVNPVSGGVFAKFDKDLLGDLIPFIASGRQSRD
jgi:hypothetical protein